MNLESQVCTLEQAKRLEELGVRSDSLFYWVKTPNEKWGIFYCENIPYADIPYAEEPEISAYTSSEIGEMISKIIFREACPGFLFVCAKDGSLFSTTDIRFWSNEINEAHARADFFIYFLENRGNVDIRQR